MMGSPETLEKIQDHITPKFVLFFAAIILAFMLGVASTLLVVRDTRKGTLKTVTTMKERQRVSREEVLTLRLNKLDEDLYHLWEKTGGLEKREGEE